jgi:hypothetical protein
MTIRNERARGATTTPSEPEPRLEAPLYTRYCAAPRPQHPVGEPSLIHSMLVAAWLGRLVDPLPHLHKKHDDSPRHQS